MQKWAYLVFQVGKDPLVDIQLTLEKLGGKGWELVAVVTDEQYGVLLYLKRPKPY